MEIILYVTTKAYIIEIQISRLKLHSLKLDPLMIYFLEQYQIPFFLRTFISDPPSFTLCAEFSGYLPLRTFCCFNSGLVATKSSGKVLLAD